MRSKKCLAVLLAATTLVLGLAGCGGAQASSSTGTKNSDSGSGKNPAKELRIALQPVPAYLPLTVLQDKGWLEEALKKEGYSDVKVKFTEFESGPPENEAFASGDEDVGVMGNVPSISAIASGQDRTIIGISENGEKTEAVLVPKDSDIKSVEDLKGKKIGLVVGSICNNLVDTLLKSVNLTSKDVNLVNLAPSEQESALSTGQVDAVATWQPTIAKIENDGVGVLLADGSGGLFLAENSIFVQTDYLKKNPDIVRIFLQQYARAAAEVKNNQEDYSEKYADKYGISADLTFAALKDANYPIAINDTDIKDLQGTADYLVDSGIVTTKVTVKDHVDKQFADDETIQKYLSTVKSSS